MVCETTRVRCSCPPSCDLRRTPKSPKSYLRMPTPHYFDSVLLGLECSLHTSPATRTKFGSSASVLRTWPSNIVDSRENPDSNSSATQTWTWNRHDVHKTWSGSRRQVSPRESCHDFLCHEVRRGKDVRARASARAAVPVKLLYATPLSLVGVPPSSPWIVLVSVASEGWSRERGRKGMILQYSPSCDLSLTLPPPYPRGLIFSWAWTVAQYANDPFSSSSD